ncbi:hypothetical protein ACEOSU_19975 [Pseudomonas aeruginosa]
MQEILKIALWGVKRIRERLLGWESSLDKLAYENDAYLGRHPVDVGRRRFLPKVNYNSGILPCESVNSMLAIRLSQIHFEVVSYAKMEQFYHSGRYESGNLLWSREHIARIVVLHEEAELVLKELVPLIASFQRLSYEPRLSCMKTKHSFEEFIEKVAFEGFRLENNREDISSLSWMKLAGSGFRLVISELLIAAVHVEELADVSAYEWREEVRSRYLENISFYRKRYSVHKVLLYGAAVLISILLLKEEFVTSLFGMLN